MPEHRLLAAFNAGYDAGADAPSGELLAEAKALQSAFCDLDSKTSGPSRSTIW